MEAEILQNIGISDGETRVYQALLELGISNLHGIQEKVGIDRRNIYDILNKLIEKGLASYTLEHGKRSFQLTHPSKIINYLEEKEQEITNSKMLVQKALPELLVRFNESKTPIRAETFRGNEALKALLEEILEHEESFWIGGNSGIEKTNRGH